MVKEIKIDKEIQEIVHVVRSYNRSDYRDDSSGHLHAGIPDSMKSKKKIISKDYC